MKHDGLKPKTMVDYTREPFVFGPGNVRITLDYNIRTGLSTVDFLNNSCVTVPIANNPIILEIKWDEYLPDIIKDIIQLNRGRIGAFSKYAACSNRQCCDRTDIDCFCEQKIILQSIHCSAFLF